MVSALAAVRLCALVSLGKMGRQAHLRAHLIEDLLELLIWHHALAFGVKLRKGADDRWVLHERRHAVQKVALRAALGGEREI